MAVTSASHRLTRLDWKDIQTQHPYNPLLAYKRSKLAQDLATDFTVYVPDPSRTEVRLNGDAVPALSRNPADHTGRGSVSIPWPRLRFPVP